MTTNFSADLRLSLEYTSKISRERSRQWNTQTSPLLHWQSEAFMGLLNKDGAESIDKAWEVLHQNESTKDQAELLHQELLAIIEFQRPLVDIEAIETAFRKNRPLKKGIDLIKTLLKSIKEILGHYLGPKWNAALQLAIEAADVFV